jgi:hypothetical protein
LACAQNGSNWFPPGGTPDTCRSTPRGRVVPADLRRRPQDRRSGTSRPARPLNRPQPSADAPAPRQRCHRPGRDAYLSTGCSWSRRRTWSTRSSSTGRPHPRARHAKVPIMDPRRPLAARRTPRAIHSDSAAALGGAPDRAQCAATSGPDHSRRAVGKVIALTSVTGAGLAVRLFRAGCGCRCSPILSPDGRAGG